MISTLRQFSLYGAVLSFSALAQPAPAPAGAPPAPAPAAAQPAPAAAQPAPAAAAVPSPLESLNKALKLYIFPAKQQTKEVQDKDMNDCYAWGVQQSGVNPLTDQPTQAAATNQGPDGSAVKGAAKGALVGAMVGGITGNAGRGAAIGAAGGAVGGAARGGAKKQQQAAQAQAQAQQTDAQKVESFKKAYSVCLEGKGYTVK